MPKILNPNDILVAEFNYAKESATQANEDRIKVFNLFIANVGTLLAAVTVPQLTNFVSFYFFAFIFLFLFIVGIITLLQLVKIRLAWIESAKAMNQIKEYYVKNLDSENLEKAFRWRVSNIPKAGKIFTIAYLLALTNMIVNSISVGAFIFFLTNASELSFPIFIALLSFVIQQYIWFKTLNGKRRAIEQI
jgi:hypothetical protein